MGNSQVSWAWLLKATPMYSYPYRGHTQRMITHRYKHAMTTLSQDLCPQPHKAPQQEKDTTKDT